MTNMYNPQLETFIRVADAGSFNRAAEESFITPTAVIKQINSLESALEVKLFDRSHRGLTLTKAGRSMHQDAKYIIQYFTVFCIHQNRAQRCSASWTPPKACAMSCTTDYNPKVYADQQSETSYGVSL